MSALLDCPSPEQWPALLDETAAPEQREAYERHLECCSTCQDRLHQAEACAEGLRRLNRRVGDPTATPPDPTLVQVLERLREMKPADRPALEPVDLHFLSLTDRPGLLGMLDEYEVQEVIGQGGFGVVLKAWEPALQRLVAIKVLSPAVAGNAIIRRRFTREAQAAAAVCHDHVVAVHRVSDTAGLPYLVMQYVGGESLQARLDRNGPLETAEIVRIGMQTASGLAAAHAQGLIHRDIKPANLLLENGLARVKITDFGLARTVDDVGLTQDGVVAGTPEYMAPEQARGEVIDHRADLFSLGSVLYACCTGIPPFRASTTVALLRRVSDEDPVPVRSLNPDIPAWLEALVGRLMAKDPEQRFRTAAEVAALLEGYLAHIRQPVTVAAPEFLPAPSTSGSAPEDTGTQAEPPCAPRSLRLLLGSAALVALVLASVVLAALGLQDGGQKAAGERPAPVPAVNSSAVWSVALSQDGKVLAAGAGMWDQPGEIGVWDLATREPLQRFTEELGVCSVALSPDGRLLASGSWTGHVGVYDWRAGKRLFDFPVGDAARVAFSPDGRLLAIATEGKAAQLWDMAEGKLAADLQGDLIRFHCVAFSPDGSRVLAGGGDWKPAGVNQVAVWEVAGRTQVMTLTGHSNAVLVMTYSPDGKTIATGSADRTIRLWDAGSGKHLKTLSGHKGFVECLIFAADGKTLVSGGLDRTIRFWNVEQGTETDRIPMPGEVRGVRFTPDGETLVAGGTPKTLKLISTTTRKDLAFLWNGTEQQAVAMDLFPVAAPMQVAEKRWLTAAGLVGLGLAFLISVCFAAWVAMRQRPGAPDMEAPLGPVSFPCSHCGKKLKVAVELGGRKVRCPRCGKAARVPESETAEVPTTPPRRWRSRLATLAAFAAPAVIAALFFGVLSFSRAGKAPPGPSRLQMLADRVRAQKSEVIDARHFPSIGDRDLSVLVGLGNLKTLNLDHTEITDAGLKDVARAGNLVSLSLTNTSVTDAGLDELKPLIWLEDLRLDKLPISDAGLARVRAFSKLRKLSLYQTKVSDDGLAHLKTLLSLEHLSLDETQIGDEGLHHLAECPSLKYVSLWRTRVTPAGVQELRRALPKLQVNR
jgi:serine/threonine protein kinase